MKAFSASNVINVAGIASDTHAVQPEGKLTVMQPRLSSGQQLWFDAHAVLIT